MSKTDKPARAAPGTRYTQVLGMYADPMASFTRLEIEAATGMTRNSAQKVLSMLCKRKDLHSRASYGYARYYVSKEAMVAHAEAFAALAVIAEREVRMVSGATMKAHRMIRLGPPKAKEPKPPKAMRINPDQGGARGRRPPGDGIIPPGLEVQRSKPYTHDPRYQCAPGERPEGAGLVREWHTLRGVA